MVCLHQLSVTLNDIIKLKLFRITATTEKKIQYRIKHDQALFLTHTHAPTHTCTHTHTHTWSLFKRIVIYKEESYFRPNVHCRKDIM